MWDTTITMGMHFIVEEFSPIYRICANFFFNFKFQTISNVFSPRMAIIEFPDFGNYNRSTCLLNIFAWKITKQSSIIRMNEILQHTFIKCLYTYFKRTLGWSGKMCAAFIEKISQHLNNDNRITNCFHIMGNPSFPTDIMFVSELMFATNHWLPYSACSVPMFDVKSIKFG